MNFRTPFCFRKGECVKKIISIFWVLLLSVSFYACVEPETAERQSIEYTKYDTLIQLLEENNFDGARNEISLLEETAYQAQVKDGVLEEILLSADNCNEYFEVIETTEWCENDLGGVTGFVIHVCIALKPEYVQRVVADKTSADFQWQATCSTKNCDIDLENRIIHIENVFQSNSTTFGEPAVYTGTVSFQPAFLSDERFSENAVIAKIGEIILIGEYSYQNEMKSVCYDYDDTNIIEACGTLVLTGGTDEE